MDQEIPHLAVIILAAGGSKRLGTPKQLLTVKGTTLVQRAVRECVGLVDSRLIVVIGSNAAGIAEALQDDDIDLVHNDDWATGIASSLRVGLAAVSDGADGVMICLCDQPFVTRDDLRMLVDQWATQPDTLVASEYAGTLGVPAIFPARVFDALSVLEGDAGAKSIIDRDASRLAVPLPAAAIDIDRPEDVLHLSAD
jgi:molybdenum cofactor cytidylyltransferase